jgi:hypothetical protein
VSTAPCSATPPATGGVGPQMGRAGAGWISVPGWCERIRQNGRKWTGGGAASLSREEED